MEKRKGAAWLKRKKKFYLNEIFIYFLLQNNALEVFSAIYYFSIWGDKLDNKSNFFFFP